MTGRAHDRCFWTDTARAARPASPLNGEVEADVAIIGAGIAGVVAARLLKDRGRRVALVEAGRAGHGVTGRSTAKVTAQHSTYLQRIEKDHGADAARAYAAANVAGVALIEQLVARHRLDCDYGPADSWAYSAGEDGVAELEAEAEAASRAGLPMQLKREIDLPFPVAAALLLPDQRQFQPVDFVAQLAATLPGDGSHLFEHSLATGWDDDRVETESGAIKAKRVIMATHLPLAAVGQFHARTSPHMHAILAVPVAADRAPPGMYISVDQPKRSIRSCRAPNGETFLILTGPTFTHGDADAEMAGFAELEAFARDSFGAQGGAYRWTNEDYASSDGLPFVGWSGVDGSSLLVATGFNAWGLSNGAVAGQLLADACDGIDNRWAGLFDPSRGKLKGLGEAAANAASFVGGLVKGHAKKPPEPDAAETPCEGAIVHVDGRAAGLYSEGGRLRAVSAVCTHMGCLVGWNPVDRSWDCPCHGSRFASDGAVVHGPATKPLPAVPWPPEQEG